MRTATKSRGETLSPAKTFSPFKPSPRDAAKEFSAVILPFSVGELATAANTSKETAKCWKNGRAFPSGTKLLALMAEFSHVQSWADSKTGAHRESPQVLASNFELLERLLASDTAEGRAMRARAAELMRAD